MTDYELLEIDRIAKIQSINKQYDLENNAYLSFSGRKDSTVLHYLLDLALPNNKIPRVFINTGIEYLEIVKFVKGLAANDDRFVLISPTKNIKNILEEYGYPFKSKEHSQRIYEFNRNSKAPFLKRYITGIDKNGNSTIFKCPKKLLYQFEERGKYKYSHMCCFKLKKEPAVKWQKENNKSIVITGMKRVEGGNRVNINCIVTSKSNKLKKFHPLTVVTDEWEDWFIETHNIKLCKLYYPPFNFKRTGCKGCPFAPDLQHILDIMERLLPAEKAQCEKLWAPVYEEYRCIGYRLRKKGSYRQCDLFDFISQD